MSNELPVLTPRLIVSSTDRAITFYENVFGAEELERYTTPDGTVVHAAISIRGAILSLADAKDDWYPPVRPDGSPVLLTLMCDDPDAVAQLAVEHGAEILIPVDDRFYGHREGRIKDPFGHLWFVSRVLEKRSPEEVQQGVDALES